MLSILYQSGSSKRLRMWSGPHLILGTRVIGSDEVSTGVGQGVLNSRTEIVGEAHQRSLSQPSSLISQIKKLNVSAMREDSSHLVPDRRKTNPDVLEGAVDDVELLGRRFRLELVGILLLALV